MQRQKRLISLQRMYDLVVEIKQTHRKQAGDAEMLTCETDSECVGQESSVRTGANDRSSHIRQCAAVF